MRIPFGTMRREARDMNERKVKTVREISKGTAESHDLFQFVISIGTSVCLLVDQTRSE